MADDITLTVNVRNMARGEFQRLDQQLDRLRRDVRNVGSASASSSQRMNQLNQSMGAVQGRMRRLQQTGQMTGREMIHMRQSISLVNRELANAARAGEITTDQYRRLRAQSDQMRTSFDTLSNTVRLHNTNVRQGAHDADRLRMAQERLRLAWVRSEQAAARIRQTDDRLRLSQMRLGDSTKSVGNNASFAGGMFSNLRAKLIGSAVVLGASLLPTIGALAPMIAGLTGIVGVAALAFSGLSKPTKMLSKDEKEFLKSIKPLTKEFRELQKTARKALLPELSKSFKDVGKAMDAMNPVLEVAGKGLGQLVGKIAKGVAKKDFMGPFLKNVKMGTNWIFQFTGSFGKFAKSFFEFGTKSQPALDAWQDLLGGFLDRGLPGMFKGLESGIGGASDYLRGLSSLINDGLLPGLGKLVGKFMEAFGPTIGDILREVGRNFNELSGDIGDLFVALAPVGKFVGNIITGFLDLGRIGSSVFFDLAKQIGGAFLKTFTEVFSGDQLTSLQTGVESLSTWVQNNEGSIRSAFTQVAGGIIDMVNAGVQGIPQLLTALKGLVEVSLTSFDAIISGSAYAFGWIPGIGDKLKDANTKFDEFAAGVRTSLDDAITTSQNFADAFGPNAERAKLTLNVDQAKAALEDIKTKLKDPELTKERRAKLTADKADAERKVKEAESALSAFDKKRAKPKIDADASGFFNKVAAATRAKIPTKYGPVAANTNPFWSAVHGLADRVVGTSYVNVVQRAVGKVGDWFKNANGGVYRAFADGGVENHQAQIAPGGPVRMWAERETGGEAYLPLGPSKRSRSKRVAEQAVGIMGGSIEWFAKGGMSQATKDARRSLTGSFGISTFGRYAGYQRTPFERSLAVPGDSSSLVTNLNQVLGQIKNAFSGSTEKRLVAGLMASGKALIRNQKNLEKVNASLDKAKTKLDDLKQAAASLKDSVTSGVLSATDVTQAASGDKNVTMSDVMAQMRNSVDKSTAFSGALAQLKARGVSKDIINQIATAGINGGGLETAGAILAGSSSEIQTLNEMQSRINTAANTAGKTASDAMYAAGIKAADGMVKGLQKRQDAIEAQMLKIAKSMEKAIKRALGIKSPSKVMEKVGHYTAEGFALGMAKNRKVSNAWTTVLDVPSSGRPIGGSSGSFGGGGEVVLPIYIGNQKIEEVILDVNRRVVRKRGGDVQKVFGGR